MTWAQTQEREFRVFATSDEKRLRFKPMASHQRAFLHALAEDYGLDSESQDPEPHRHVCVFKTPRFVSAPRKTLAQCVRIAKTAAALGASASSVTAAAPAAGIAENNEAFNALLLQEPRFGLTVDELDEALSAELVAAGGRPAAGLSFTTSFLPSDEIVIHAKSTAMTTAATVATSAPQSNTPKAIEAVLSSLKPVVAKTVTRLGLAKGPVLLCRVDTSLNVLRRETPAGSASSGGWNAVASRGSWRRGGAAGKAQQAAAEQQQQRPSGMRSFVALRRLKREDGSDEEEKKKVVATKVKKVAEEEVEDDWLAAAEKLEGFADDNGEGSEGPKEEQGKDHQNEKVEEGEGVEVSSSDAAAATSPVITDVTPSDDGDNAMNEGGHEGSEEREEEDKSNEVVIEKEDEGKKERSVEASGDDDAIAATQQQREPQQSGGGEVEA